MKKTISFFLSLCLAVGLQAQSDSLLMALKQQHKDLKLTSIYEGTALISAATTTKNGFLKPKTQAMYDVIGGNQGSFAAAKRNGVWGLIDTMGKEVGRWDYENLIPIESYKEEFALGDWETSKNGKTGRIRFNGKEVLLPEYDRIIRYETKYLAKKDKKWGVIDTNGHTILPLIYDDINMRYGEYYLLEKDSLSGVMDMATLQFILPIAYKGIMIEKYGFIIRKEKGLGFADETGKIIISPIHKRVEVTANWVLVSDSTFHRLKRKRNDFSSNLEIAMKTNMATCSQDSENVHIWAIYDSTGKQVLAPQYEDIIYWGNNRFCVTQNHKKGIISLENKVLTPIQYDEILALPHWQTITIKDSFYTLQDLAGNVLQSNFNAFFLAETEKESFIWIHQQGSLKVLDSLGKVIVSYKVDDKKQLEKRTFTRSFDNDYEINEGLVPVTINGILHLIAPNGKVIAKGNVLVDGSRWQEINLIAEIIEKKEKATFNYTAYNQVGEKMYQIKDIDRIELFDNDDILAKGEIIPISRKEKYGYLNIKTGKMIIPFRYEDADNFEKGFAKVTTASGDDFYINTQGKRTTYAPKKQGFDFEEMKSNQYEGIIDTTGKIIVPVSYKDIKVYQKYIIAEGDKKRDGYDYTGKQLWEGYEIKTYKDSLFILQNAAKKVGMMNLEKQVIFPFNYEDIKAVGEKYAVKQTGKWALAAAMTKNLTDYKYDEIKAFAENAYWVKKQHKWQLIDSVGHLLNSLTFTSIDHSSSSLVDAVKRKDKWAIIQNDGTLLSTFQKNKYQEWSGEWVNPFEDLDNAILVKEKEAYYFISTRANDREGFYDEDFTTTAYLSQKYDSIYLYQGGCTGPMLFVENHAKVGKKGLWGLADREGKEKVAPIYAEIENKYGYNEGNGDYFQLQKTNGKFTVYFPSQNYLAKNEYAYIGEFREGMVAFSQDKKTFGYIDTLGNIVIPAQYTIAEHFSENMAVVQVGEKTGLIDKTGKWLIAPQYEALEIMEDNAICVKKDCKFQLYNRNNQALSAEYDIINEERAFLMVMKSEKVGAIDTTGKEIVPCMFEKIEEDVNYMKSTGVYYVTQKEKTGIWDVQKQKLSVPCEYEKIKWLDSKEGKHYFIATQKDKVGVIDNENKIIIPFAYEHKYNDNFLLDGKEWRFDRDCLCLKPVLGLEITRLAYYWRWK